MTDTLYSADEKLGLLLYALGPEAAEQGLGQLPAGRAEAVRNFLRDLNHDPPTASEIRFVLDDFESYFRFAMEQIPPPQPEAAAEQAGSSAGGEPRIIQFPTVASVGDPAADLRRLDPWQVAMALADDQPMTIALVLSQLPPLAAGRILENLPEQLRQASFLQLSRPQTASPAIVRRLLQKTFERASSILQRREELDHLVRMVELMRSLPKQLRIPLLASLNETDQDLAAAIREKMYRFDDIARLDDRSIQLVLTRVPSDRLIMALTRADAQISGRIFGNMSKRARETVEEEIGFNEKASDADIEAARLEIAQVLSRMDESGEISL